MPQSVVHRAAAVLRALTPADVDAVHTLLSDWNVVQYMSLPYCTTQEATAKCLDDLLNESTAGWRSLVFAITTAAHELIGLCGIVVWEEVEEGEIWYLIRPDHQGRGIAASAAGELMAMGFGELHLRRVFATCLPENPASARVLEKIGMRRDRRQERTVEIHGVLRRCWVYSICACS